MRCVFLAELAILHEFHAVRRVLLLLGGCIVSVLTFRASEHNPFSHVYTSRSP